MLPAVNQQTQALTAVAEFVRRVRTTLTPLAKSPQFPSFWISRPGAGSPYLDEQEVRDYAAVLKQLRD